MTQKNVYELLGVSPNCYASWEQGRTQPDISMIKKLCEIFDVSADYLLAIEDIKTPVRYAHGRFYILFK